MSKVTQLIESAQQGNQAAVHELLPLVYAELRKLAAIRLSNDGAGKSLQPTALVHEVYLRLLGTHNQESPLFANQRHFFAAAAESMRRILVDRARAKQAQKRGGDAKRVDFNLNDLTALDEDHPAELLALDEALEHLQQHDPVAVELVKLRFFGGLTHLQAAESLGMTRREADRVWALARTWLFRQLQD